jgi:hypothetical protein
MLETSTKRCDRVTMLCRIVVWSCVLQRFGPCTWPAISFVQLQRSRLDRRDKNLEKRASNQYSGMSQMAPRGILQIICMGRAAPTLLCHKHVSLPMAGHPSPVKSQTLPLFYRHAITQLIILHKTHEALDWNAAILRYVHSLTCLPNSFVVHFSCTFAGQSEHACNNHHIPSFGQNEDDIFCRGACRIVDGRVGSCTTT